jgi:DNA-binding Lrp family transcriptional regulator
MKLVELDALDRKILYHLDHDGRISYSDLARKLKHGRDTVEYRVQRFLDNGIISSFQLVMNPYALGKTLYKTYIKLANNKVKVKDFISRLKKHPHVFWFVQCDGQWDLIFSVAAYSVYEFNIHQSKLLESIREILISYEVFIPIEFHQYRLKYLIKGGTHYFKIGGVPVARQLDSLELSILNILSSDGRKSISDLARDLSVTDGVVKRKLDNLEKDRIVLGYKANIETDKLGITLFKSQLLLNYRSLKEEKELEDYCNMHPKITCFIRQIGSCNLELEVHVESYSEYNLIMDEITSRFNKLIRSTSTILMRENYVKWVV